MKKVFLCFGFAIICLQVSSQKNNQDKISAANRFDAYIKNAMQLWKTPGLSVVVVKDNQLVFKKAYGVKDINTQAAFNTSTISICASTTKAMTAVCMGMLVDEGKVSWDDKVSDVYPELKLYDNYVNNELRVRDLFTHNAGLGNADWLWVFDYSMDTIIHQMRYMQPAYSYHSSFIYQNLMYMVAGEVIHKISGKPWNEFITQRLFKPLGMNNTFATYKNASGYTDKITTHYMFEDSVVKTIPFYDSKTVDAAGGVWSCADDINKWVMFILDSTKINGTKLLKPETYAELFTPQSMVTKEEFYPTQKLTHPHWTTYGLGWFQEDYKGKAVQFHTGSLDGAVAIIGLIPDEHFGIYIFANMDHTEIRHALMYKAMDMWVLNDDKNDWSKDFYKLYVDAAQIVKKQDKEQLAKRIPNTKPSLDLKSYTGTFTNQLYGEAKIELKADSLVLQFPNNISVFLSHWHYDTFMAKFERAWYGGDLLQFNLNTDGKVSSFNFAGLTYSIKE